MRAGSPSAPGRSVAVLGGGIAGLAAARTLARRAPGTRVDVLEATDRPGGKLRTVDLAGAPLDIGAEAFVVRRPEALALAEDLGLAGAVRAPAGASPALFVDGALHRLPATQVFGIPGDPGELGDLLRPETVARIADEPRHRAPWIPGQDALVGELVSRQFGRDVVDRLVDPLLGGVYAASADRLGLRVVAPGLAAELDRQAAAPTRTGDREVGTGAAPGGTVSLVEAVSSLRSTSVSGQVFGAVEGGYRRLVAALVADLEATEGVDVRLGAEVGSVDIDGGRAVVSSPSGSAHGTYDAVVCALPFHRAGEVLAGAAPDVTSEFSRVEYSSSAVVALALPPGTEVPELSGVLVAADAGRAAKAITLSSRKWAHLDRTGQGAGHVLRVSFGRLSDTAVLRHSDTELVDLAVDEIRDIAGITVRGGTGALVDHVVARWEGGLPVPGADHARSIARLGERLGALGVPVALAGAAVGGVGVPACLASADSAAAAILSRWQDEHHGTTGL